MTRKILAIFVLSNICFFAQHVDLVVADSEVAADCTFHGKPLFGKIQFVTSFPDVKVQVVNAFPDLKVERVSSFPDTCGKWQEVQSFPDLKVQIVDSFPDVKIQYVNAFPGLAH
ncbi:MAG: hypothetical protein U0136_21255 [Bdellovibrionota bacterium]